MSEAVKKPTHYRLVSALKAIGPYLREALCKDGTYHFDCLSVCVDDKKSPEDREFWGWWLDLYQSEDGFEAIYQIGRYDHSGVWQTESAPKNVLGEITRTQEVFHQKLSEALKTQFELELVVGDKSAEFV